MKRTCSLIAFIFYALCARAQESKPIPVQWVSALAGNFSFKNKWVYPEGVERNGSGQLSCDDFCPEETVAMKDSIGNIYKDSLAAFYKLVDTSHQYYSIACKAWCYEWAGTHFITAERKTKDSIACYTLCNAATHCSLHLVITGNNCYARIELNSIVAGGNAVYPCYSGKITIDKTLWQKGILKASFSFRFNYPEMQKQPMFWKGKIYTAIQPGAAGTGD